MEEMIGLGTIINVAAIIVGGMIGLLLGKGIQDRYQDIMMIAVGLSTLFLGIAGTIEKMITVENGVLSSGGSMMMTLSMVIGALIGEAIDIENKIERFGAWLKIKSGNGKDHSFVEAFVTASFVVCIGAMAIVGSIKDGISGDYSVLVMKAILDLIIILVMTASMGKGCIFSAIPVGIFQGSVTVLAKLLEPIMTEKALSNLSLVGSIMIFSIGINLIWGKKVKVANFLPAIVISVIWAFLPL